MDVNKVFEFWNNVSEDEMKHKDKNLIQLEFEFIKDCLYNLAKP